MDLIVDIGNTLIKYAVVDGRTVCAEQRGESYDERIVQAFATRYALVRSILSSSRGAQGAVQQSIEKIVGHCLTFDAQTPTPLEICYNPPTALGRDRVAAAVGAMESYPGRNILIVDFGTAITIDLLSREGRFEGGFISPGVRTRLRALHDYTASLPLLEPPDCEIEIARSTHEAIEQGVIKGIIYEIEGHIDHFSKKIDELSIIFSGGDAFFFEKRIKNTIFADRDLLIKGLIRILEYNAKR